MKPVSCGGLVATLGANQGPSDNDAAATCSDMQRLAAATFCNTRADSVFGMGKGLGGSTSNSHCRLMSNTIEPVKLGILLPPYVAFVRCFATRGFALCSKQ